MEEVPREELTVDGMKSSISMIHRVCAYRIQSWEKDCLDILDILICMVARTTNAVFLHNFMSYHGRPSRFRQ